MTNSGNGRSLAILSLLALALAAALRWLPGSDATDRTVAHGIRLLPMADGADEIVLRTGSEEPVRLVHDFGWRISAPIQAAANPAVVSRLVDALAFGKADDSMSEADLLKLGRTRADFLRADQTNEIQVVAGGRTNVLALGERLQSGEGVYAMVDGHSPVLVLATDLVAAVDMPLARFREDALFALEPGEIASFDIRREQGAFLRCERTESGWRLSGVHTGSVSSGRIAAFLERILTAKAESFVWPTGAPSEPRAATPSLLSGYGLDAESPIGIVFHATDGRDASLQFGKVLEDGLRRYALVQGGTTVVTVDETLYATAVRDATDIVDLRLWPMTEDEVRTLSIADKDITYLLARDSGGGAWHFDAPVSAPADGRTVKSILSRLLRCTKRDVCAKGLVVSLTTNLPPVTLSRKTVLGSARFEALRSRDVVCIAPESVRRLSSGETSVVRDSETQAWNVERGPEGVVVDRTSVQGILAALKTLTATSVVALNPPVEDFAAYGLDHPRFTLSVDSREAGVLRKNILIGRETATGSYATVGAFEAVFFLSRETVLRLTAPLVTKE